MNLDTTLLLWINQAWADPGLDFLFAWVSDRISFSFPLLLLLLLLFRRWFPGDGVRLWLLLVAGVALGDLFGNLLKQLFAMPRPCFEVHELLRPPGGGSPRQCNAPATGMPSSHALNFFAVATFLAYGVRRLPLTLWFYAIALLVGLSRIYLGKHYPSQVLAGAAVGVAFGWIFAWSGLRAFAFGRRVLAQGGATAADSQPTSLLVQRLLLPDPVPRPSAIVWLPLLLPLLLFLLIWLNDWNPPFFFWLNGLCPATSDTAWANITLLGDTLVAFGLLSLLARHRPDIVGTVFVAAVFALLWVHGLKPLLSVARPLAALGIEQMHLIGHALRNSSFPSGHSTTAFLLAGVVVLRGVHPGLALAAFVMAALAAVSRAVVGAHWPLDILAGMFGGWLSAAIGVWLTRGWAFSPSVRLQWLMWLFFAACGVGLLITRGLGYPQGVPLQMLTGMLCLGYAGYCLVRLWLKQPRHRHTATSVE
jgi:membrane-associated phospholipid phosphatase